MEVITLRDSGIPLSSNLSHFTYTPEVTSLVSKTRVELDETSGKLALTYVPGGRKAILEAIRGLKQNSSPPVSHSKIADSEATEILTSASEVDSQDVQIDQGNQQVQSPEENQALELIDTEEDVVDNIIESNIHGVREHLPHQRISYTVASPKFVTLPLGSPQLRFAVCLCC